MGDFSFPLPPRPRLLILPCPCSSLPLPQLLPFGASLDCKATLRYGSNCLCKLSCSPFEVETSRWARKGKRGGNLADPVCEWLQGRKNMNPPPPLVLPSSNQTGHKLLQNLRFRTHPRMETHTNSRARGDGCHPREWREMNYFPGSKLPVDPNNKRYLFLLSTSRQADRWRLFLVKSPFSTSYFF